MTWEIAAGSDKCQCHDQAEKGGVVKHPILNDCPGIVAGEWCDAVTDR